MAEITRKRDVIEGLKRRYAPAVAIAQALEGALGRERALEILQKAHDAYYAGKMEELKRQMGGNSWEHWVRYMTREPYSPNSNLVVTEIGGNYLKARVTECLHFTAFGELGAPWLCGLLCQSDYPGAQAFNPKLSMTRDHALAHGDEYCDHVWWFEE